MLPPALQTACDLLLAFAASLATAALCFQYGFYRSPVNQEWLHCAEWVVLGLFLLNRLIGLAGASERRQFLHENWFDMLVVLGSAGAAIVTWGDPLQYQAVAVGNIYVIITLLYLLAGWAIQLALDKLSPGRVLFIWAISLICLLLLAAGLLLLPKAAPKDAGLSFTNALFTAATAACNTGLAVRDLSTDLTLFGQLIVLVTMQLGALAVVSLGALAVLLLGERLTSSSSPLLGVMSARGPLNILRLAVIYTFVLEAAGAALMYPMFARYDPDSGIGLNVFRSIFHAVSAFSNTGLTLQSDNLQGLRHCWQVIGVIGPLVVLGGLGVPVMHEIFRRLRPANRAEGLSLHTKLVLVTVAAVIVIGSSILMWNEGHSYPGETFGAALSYQDNPGRAAPGKALAKLPLAEQVRESAFEVTARTTGFTTTDTNALSDGGKMLMIGYAFIGGCPGGLGGGIKVGIFAVLCLNLYHSLRGRTTVRAFGSAISWNMVRIASAAALAQVVLVLADGLLVSMFMTGQRLSTTGQPAKFLDLFMDANSACCNSGVSCGLTSSLNESALLVLIGGMIVGRFLCLAVVAMILQSPRHEEQPAQNQVVLL